LADDDHEAARVLVEAGDILPLDVILEKAQARYRGRVLEVELEREAGRHVYEIEIVDEQGVVRELYLDASSGELLKAEQEH
ncbi:MAG: PepSY domain-containing protein, partial [Pseudomonadota bacterium]